MKHYKKILAVIFASNILSACQKSLEADLSKSLVVADVVFSNEMTARSAVLGMYHDMIYDGVAAYTSSHLMDRGGLSADELINFPQTDVGALAFQHNEIPPNESSLKSLWAAHFKSIYQANAIIEGLGASTGVKAEVKEQLTGEAKLVRGFMYFYLVNLFGNLPIVTGTDYKVNVLLSRSTPDKVYALILEDLLAAEGSLSGDYPTSERVRPNKAAATAMLARVYLYLKEWEKAEQKASELIAQTAVYSLPELDEVFLAASNEAIWQLKPMFFGNIAPEASLMYIPGGQPYLQSMTTYLYNAYETGDKRKTTWAGAGVTDAGENYMFSAKYKRFEDNGLPVEYSMILRLAEQYLIRAEARIQQRRIDDGIDDLNALRLRTNLAPIPHGLTQSQAMAHVEQERRVELAVEWGHRWLDLKRWERADAVLGPIKPLWKKEDALYPVPLDELNNAPSLKPQNPGY